MLTLLNTSIRITSPLAEKIFVGLLTRKKVGSVSKRIHNLNATSSTVANHKYPSRRAWTVRHLKTKVLKRTLRAHESPSPAGGGGGAEPERAWSPGSLSRTFTTIGVPHSPRCHLCI
jgi:hypothetical protein